MEDAKPPGFALSWTKIAEGGILSIRPAFSHFSQRPLSHLAVLPWDRRGMRVGVVKESTREGDDHPTRAREEDGDRASRERDERDESVVCPQDVLHPFSPPTISATETTEMYVAHSDPFSPH